MYEHLKYISMRPSLIEYNVMFTTEQIATGNAISYDANSDLATTYNERVYENERNVFSTYSKSYPT